MQLSYDDGKKIFEPFDEQKFSQAVEDPHCVSATIYKPGSTVTMSDRTYKVGEHGNLIRVR